LNGRLLSDDEIEIWMTAMGRSPTLSNDRCAASNAAAMLRRDRSGLTGRSRCTPVFQLPMSLQG